MPEAIHDATALEAGESYFALYVDRAGMPGQIVAEFKMGLVAPAAPEDLAPRRLSGFELPALEALTLAERRANEAGVTKILVVDPNGWLAQATVNRYAR